MRLLLVEDKLQLCHFLSKSFQKERIALDVAITGEDGLSMIKAGHYAVIILDITLSGMSGITLLKQLRADKNTTPVLMLTAHDALDDKVTAFELGADDYLVKPFQFAELLVRVQALVRRSTGPQQDQIVVGNTTLDRKNHELYVGERIVYTTQKEYSLLEQFILNKGNYITKDVILHLIGGGNSEILSSNVQVYVYNLRKKFPPEEAGFAIETKPRYGYRIVEV